MKNSKDWPGNDLETCLWEEVVFVDVRKVVGLGLETHCGQDTEHWDADQQ